MIKRPFLLLLLGLSPLIVGCQGCRDDSAEADKPRITAAIVAKELDSLPSDANSPRMLVKPGHWMTISEAWQANNDDLRGRLSVLPVPIAKPPEFEVETTVRRDFKPIAVQVEAMRPAVLPKGQQKRLDCRVLIPSGPPGQRMNVDIQTRFEATNQPLAQPGTMRSAIAMQAQEYFFVVLSKRPEAFAYLQVSDWVKPPAGADFIEQPIDFRLVFPDAENALALPDTIFEWTSIAYVLWDDIGSEQLTLDQRKAIRDWVYWGGQLIINGPAGAQTFSDSDLADLLPLDGIRGEAVEPERLVGMVDSWSVESDKSKDTIKALLSTDSNRIGVGGTPFPETAFTAQTNNLIAERSFGRGRVVMTRFELTSDWLLKWQSMQSFVNATLLRRPSRKYENVQGSATLYNAGGPRGLENDARLNTKFRIFSRDGRLESLIEPSSNQPPKGTAFGDQWLVGGESYKPGEGIAAWSDRSDTALMVTQMLRDEAGIDIPGVEFVAKSLAIYLLILVPINYLVFYFLGRLEWAWVMVPIIGLVGAAWIARAARLDIGFARSQTEISVLEMQPNFERGHVTRWVAIYNSLSTEYEFKFSNRDAVAAPVGSFESASASRQCFFNQAFDETVSLTGLAIPSNQTSTLHAEQMLSVGGGIVVPTDPETLWAESFDLENRTEWSIYDAVVIGRSPEGALVYDDRGILDAGKRTQVRLRAGEGRVAPELPLGVDVLMTKMLDGNLLRNGEMKLIGRIESPLAGMEISPVVSQITGQTVVIANLSFGQAPEPTADVNLRTDLQDLDEDFFDDAPKSIDN